jgi:hypothetical protein
MNGEKIEAKTVIFLPAVPQSFWRVQTGFGPGLPTMGPFFSPASSGSREKPCFFFVFNVAPSMPPSKMPSKLPLWGLSEDFMLRWIPEQAAN